MEQFARKHGIDLHPAGHGINQQVLVGEGCAFPVASDSHSNVYDGISSVACRRPTYYFEHGNGVGCTGRYLPSWRDDGEVAR